MKRLHNLDYLRGLFAFAVMIYHYNDDFFGSAESGGILGRLAIYGVAVFYILSGLTLYSVYQKSFSFATAQIREFAVKRIFRIFPLLWLVIAAVIILAGKIPPPDTLLLNLTGLFGFVRWDSYLAMGTWSIGNEIVFYVFFPFLIFLIRESRILFFAYLGLLQTIYIYFAFFVLTPALPLPDQWINFVNPLNQMFLFAGGVACGYVFKNIKFRKSATTLVLVFLAIAFIFYPVTDGLVHAVTGWKRLGFTLIKFGVCICFYKMEYELPSVIHKPLTLLGEASYSVYLLHPLVAAVVLFCLRQTGITVSAMFTLLLCVAVTLVISYLVHTYFEKYFINLAKRITRSRPKAFVLPGRAGHASEYLSGS